MTGDAREDEVLLEVMMGTGIGVGEALWLLLGPAIAVGNGEAEADMGYGRGRTDWRALAAALVLDTWFGDTARTDGVGPVVVSIAEGVGTE